MPGWMEAGGWGAVSASALLLGAVVGWLVPVPRRLVAAVMAFGSGVLISALSFDLMDEAYRTGGYLGTAVGFIAGSAVFTGANVLIARSGGKHRKRSGEHQARAAATDPGGLAIAVGSLLDGVPESVAIGLTMLDGGAVSMVAVIAIFLSNVPEGLSSSVGMRRAGRSAGYVFGLWGIAIVACALAAIAGYALFAGLPPELIAASTAFAAGAILTMLVDTMIPEAFEVAHDFAGLVTVAGFLAAFVLTKLA